MSREFVFIEKHGFRTFYCYGNEFVDNLAYNNSRGGFKAHNNVNNSYLKNEAYNNTVYGYNITGSENVTVFDNIVNYNTHGFILWNSEHMNLTKNV